VHTAVVHLQAERTMPAAVAALLPALSESFRGDVAILPASLEATDPVAEAVRDHLPPAVSPAIVTPLTGAAARRALLLPAVVGDWTTVPIAVPGAGVAGVLLPGAIATATRVVAVDVVEVARRGPFVLDVVARYVHPRQRLRLVADRQRSSLVAEVASAALPSLSVVSLGVPGGALVAMTTDAIAAELVALALAERCIGPARVFTGPWEDAVVQRATELQLGVLMPAGITFRVGGTAAPEPWAVALVEHLGQRLGLPAREG
jgi:hypothetical protein